MNNIIVSLYENIGNDIVATKPHINRGTCIYLEIIFFNKEKLQDYRVEIFNKIYFGSIPTDNRRSFLLVKIRNILLLDKKLVSKAIKDIFEDVRKIASIKPLLIEGTLY